VYRENRIVVDYDYEALVLLGAYDEDGVELDQTRLAEVAAAAGMRTARSHACGSMGELIATTRALGLDLEGFVVRFENGLRLKLKGEEYCRVHRVMSGCTPLALWESMVAGGDLDAMRRDLPEEMLARL
jgi:RNA ligase